MYQGKILVELPRIEYVREKVEMSAAERARYDVLRSLSQKKFQSMVKGGGNTKSSDSSTWDGKKMTNALVLLLRLRQFCVHAALVPESAFEDAPSPAGKRARGKEEGEDDTAAADKERFRQALEMATQDQCVCAICLEVATDAVLTACFHTYCGECANELQQRKITACPLCRTTPITVVLKAKEMLQQELDEASPLIRAATQSQVADDVGSKMIAILRIVQQRMKDEKIVIFSQWPYVLKRIALVLKTAGIQSAILEGSMSLDARNANVESFTSDEKVRVMLLSTMAGGTGLNLVCASVCIMADPWWNPAVDRQAVMRVHRIGQSKSVTVYQMIVKDSVEEKVLELQEKKQKMFDGTMGSGDGSIVSTSTSLTVDDLKMFFA
eukprot:PhF_6_TR31805/c1_g1_i1/m.46921